jgi:A/G-specific adenine glycosylase
MSKPEPERSAVELRRALLDHYDRHQRRLPWRGERDPYRILVSEVMLQQTRVETVLDYYEAWLERFPDLESLAAAETDDVLEVWEGLGYYRRARNLHGAARLVRERHGGSLPDDFAALRELPGVGAYTAGAVASIAFGERTPAVDGNVRRVLARIFDVPDPKPAWLRDTAADLVDPDRPGDWNQALMELGATICTPRGPRCGRCPVAEWCSARAAGTQEERPVAVSRKPPRRAVFVVAVLHDGGRVLLGRRPEGGLLGGMWAFPEVEVGVEDADGARDAATTLAAGLVGGKSGPAGAGPATVAEAGRPAAEPLPWCEHRFTHLAAKYVPYLVDATDLSTPEPGASSANLTWVDLGAEPVGVALPVAQRRILESVRDHLGSAVA